MAYSKHSSFRLPAEWEQQSGIQLTWPHADTDWRPYLDDITETFMLLAREIALRETLLVVTPDAEATRRQLTDRWGRELVDSMRFYTCPTNDTWARDHGAITMTSAQATSPRFASNHLLDFKFNGWGEKFDWQYDNAITQQLYSKEAFCGIVENHTDFVLEGGSIESDGEGTLLTTSSCLLAPHRNQPLSREQIEDRLLNLLNADRLLWVDHGYLAGDDTDGHIDTLVRMAPDNTLVYVGCDDANDEHYQELQAMEQQLATFRTRDGQPYRLLRLPMPRAMYDGDDRLPATYANFVILNGAVIVPTYGQPDNDAEATAIIQQAFPDRKMIGIDASTVVRQHGSLHCLTMQFPTGVL